MGQIVIVVDNGILRHFKAECVRREVTPTQAINELIQGQLRTWIQEGVAVPACLDAAERKHTHA